MSEVAADLSEELLALEQALLTPEGRADAGTLTNMLTDDFVEYGSSGRVWTKSETISRLTREAPAPSVGRLLTDTKVRRLSVDVALVTYTLRRRVPRQPEISTLRSSIWTHSGGRWRMMFHQGTVVADAE